MDSPNSGKNYKSSLFSRIAKWVLSIFFSLILFGSIFIYIFLDPIVKKRIIRAVHHSSKGMYILEIGDLNAKFWSGAVSMKEVWLKPDSNQLKVMQGYDTSAYIPNVNFYFDSVNISSIEWIKYLLNRKKLEVGVVLINRPDFIIHSRSSPSQSLKETGRNFLDLLPGIIAAFTGSLYIEEILVREGDLHNDIHGEEGVIHQLADSIYMDLKQIVIDTTSEKNALYSESASFEFRNYSLTTPDNVSFLFISHARGTVEDSILKMEKIYFSQRDSASKNDKDGIEISMQAINARGVDYRELLREQKIFFRTMILHSPDVELRASENPVKKYAEKKQSNKDESILEEVIPYLASTFRIDTLSVKDGSVRYHIENDKQKITQSAENINLDFSRVLVDSSGSDGSKIYVEDMRINLENYSLLKDNTSNLKITSFKASVSDSTLKLQGIDLKSKEKDNEEYFLKVKEVEGKGMDFMSIFKEKKIWMNSMVIKSPVVKMSMGGQENTNKKKKTGGDIFKNIMGPLADASLKVKSLIISDGNVSHLIKTDSINVEQDAKHVFLTFKNFLIDSSSAANADFFDSFFMELNKYELKVHHENFFINIKNINASSQRSSVKMNDITISQIYSFREFQRYYFINSIKSANLSGLDFNRLIKEQELHSESLDLNSMQLEIFLDQGKALRPEYARRMPQELMQKIKFYLRIDTLNVKDSYIAYSDQQEDKKVMKFTFEQVNVAMTNFSNDPALMTDSTPAYLCGEALLMGKGFLEFYITIPLLSPDFDAHYGGVVHEINASKFNEFLAYAAVEVESGKILTSTFDVDIKKGSATGELELVYKDLHVKVLNEETGKPSRIKSLFGNLILKNNNPNDKGEDPEVVQVSAKRSDEDSFFFFLWRVLRGGIIETTTKSTLYRMVN